MRKEAVMRSRAFRLGYFEGLCAKYKDSKYRRYREYAGYLDRWLHGDGVVDGCDKEIRLKHRLPMSMIVYFG